MKNISVLGSTGSIGRQTLEVAAANPDKIKIRVLAAHKNVALMLNQIEAFNPDFAVLADKEAAVELKRQYRGKTEILSGQEGLLAASTYEKADTVLGAMVGYAGLRPTLAAIASGKDIALANKETLVAAGHLVMKAVQENHVSLLPVDSEHSAIFQSLRAGYHPCLSFTDPEQTGSEVRRLILTASGGPFLGKTKEELKQVTLQQCLKHPNWSMGKKVTIDSSTLANKGLEVIEAHWLFNMPYEKIDVVVHPQSIVHSLVEFNDGAVIAQMGIPDMKLPIQYALSFPSRYNRCFGQLDLVKCGELTFEEPNREAFPLLQIATDCGKAGGSLPCAFNAANEECVTAFIDEKIKYPDIPEIVNRIVDAHQNISHPGLEEIEEADKLTRIETREMINKL
ncbi:MAG: 1-deoxy-D-xylulose-5-phosphate reductoisomerase [Succiniclasticum sp.]|uniref:1-deoxy-D-xylulose-5-phosphate reductoisomerase n=1 Tax=Succiniclasticum sp. TaxID=2775030 RepID=UPI002A91095D|nr:1-deoxy-D-xylulose-5-phosphate reductoisomerase [Succiniclasticum sp.]MDY6290579.1 1-deoxy-D-xylulose-5-phosphate reductoisomerase [Succiniclasticum sp.]